MNKFFNTAGFCNPKHHYMVDPLKRIDNIKELIEKELYFTIHAPRQTGKTTFLYAMAKELNGGRNYIALVVSFESAGYGSISVEQANRTLNRSIFEAACIQLPKEFIPEDPQKTPDYNVKSYLNSWCRSLEKPLILFIDEIDALLDDVLIAVLRQLRDGYQARPAGFPSSVALVGLRDVRDYKAKLRPENVSLGTASPFNVKSKSIFMGNFTYEEVTELLTQHTEETGQIFSKEVIDEIFRLTEGQPWLVNALANQIVNEILKDDHSKEITLNLVNQAKIELIQRRDTHLDSLADKLKEKRVKTVVQGIINGDNMVFDILDDDIVYMRDLGLISQKDPIRFANPIYGEIIPRIMAYPMQASLPMEVETSAFEKEDGSLDMDKLLVEFQEFYRENGEIWLERYEYKESAHHLLLMAFLQRVINSGGELVREMALGNQRLDILVLYKNSRYAMELKIYRGERALEKGKKQLSKYLDKLGLKMGYLVLFDPREKSWEEKIYWTEEEFQGKKIIIVGL